MVINFLVALAQKEAEKRKKKKEEEAQRAEQNKQMTNARLEAIKREQERRFF